jgi:alpha-D-ribose 1-methylphosphonate 5-triphosphate synthase subunit PhnH
VFERLRINEALFPRGIDVVLVADDAMVAIPRTTRIVSRGS